MSGTLERGNQMKILNFGSFDVDWLYVEAQRIVENAKISASDGTVLYSPGVYRGVWARDFEFIVHNTPELIKPEEIKEIYYYLLRHQKDSGAMPKGVSSEGKPHYVCWTASRKEEIPWHVRWDRQDPTDSDSAQYMVKLVYDYYKYTGDIELFVSTCSNLKRAMDFMPRSPLGMIYISPNCPHTPFGFTDCIVKTGNVLFSSLLYWEASMLVSEMFNNIGNEEAADDFLGRSKLIKKNIDVLWDEQEGAYLAATGVGRKIDIWGNAYMTAIDFPTDKRKRVCAFLAENCDRFVYHGQIRHLLKGDYWEYTVHPNTGTVPKDEYQNGAYWAAASGWVIYAVSQVAQDLASKLISDLVNFFQKEGIYECINDKGWRKYKDYVASIVNPVGAIKRLLE